MAGGIGREAMDIGSIAGIQVSGKIPTTAAGGGSNVAVTNVSGDVRVTAGALPVQVSVAGVTRVSGQIKTTAVGAGGAAVAITNVSGQVPVTAGGAPLPVTVAGQPLAMSAAAGLGGLVTAQMHAVVDDASPADVNEGVFGAVRMTSARAMHVGLMTNPVGATIVSGALRTTAVGAGGAAVAITNVSGAIRVTAADLPLPVTVAAQPLAVSAAAATWPVQITNVSGQVAVTAPGGPLTDVCGVNRTASALNTFIAGVSGQVIVTSPGGPLTDVCGVNRTGSALNTFIAGTSAQIHVTAGDLAVPVTIAAQPVAVSIAANAAVAVSQNAPLAWEIGLRGDQVYNALVSNPVKFAKIQINAAACTDVVAAVASRRIRVLGATFHTAGTCTAWFLTTGASAALTGKLPLAAGAIWPPQQWGYLETAVGSALSIQTETAVQLGGTITYTEVF